MKSTWVFAIAAFLAPLSGLASDPSPAVFEAIRNDDLAFLKSMPKSDVERPDGKGATPLMHAAAFGSPQAMRLLLDKGAIVTAKNAFEGMPGVPLKVTTPA